MTAVVFSSGILKIAGIQQMLGMEVVSASKASGRTLSCVLGWGVRENTEKARRFAESQQMPFASLEEGFIRSAGLGSEGYSTLSIVCDESGIYYDATRSSDLESLLNADRMVPHAVLEDAQRAMDLMLQHGVSKYSNTTDFRPELLRDRSDASRHVLVVDQSYGDLAVVFGGASSKTFAEMLQAAILENPDAQVWVKAHPETIVGKKNGYLVEIAEKNGIPVINDHVSPFSLFPHFDRVYTVSSQMGLEALLAGKKVTCFGMPWYAGWGVTDDRVACDRRKKMRSVLEIFAAAYLMYSRYLNPSTGEAGTIFDVIEQMAVVRRREKSLAGRVFAMGLSRSRRARLAPALKTHGNNVHFIQDFRRAYAIGVDRDSKVFTWDGELFALADILVQHAGCKHLVFNDGLLARLEAGESAGGVYAFSIERGGMGAHYGAKGPSVLDHLLSEGQVFSEQILSRAHWLIKQIVQHRITHDGLDAGGPLIRKVPEGRRVLVVLGERDEDVSNSGSHIQSSYDLLKKLRASHPDAFIIYRPCSDSFSGGRFAGIAKGELGKVCDHVEFRAGVTHVIDVADEVHVICDSVGFFALMRGKKVVCYGMPFFAGWGLTEDLGPSYLMGHRKVTRRLDEVVAAAFIQHSVYFDSRLRHRCEPEDYVRWLTKDQRKPSAMAASKPGVFSRLFRRAQ